MKLRFDIQQNTEEWDEIKIGKFSASIAADLLMDKTNKGYVNLINRITEERITCKKSESKSFQGNQYTERGHELEGIARDDFEIRNFENIVQIGVIELDDWVLCSPDGLIGDNGLWQGKCPIFNTHREYFGKYNKLISEGKTHNEILIKISSQYYKQMQFELFVSGREYNYFTSYHPYLPAIDLKIIRDNSVIDFIKDRISESKVEINDNINYLISLQN